MEFCCLHFAKITGVLVWMDDFTGFDHGEFRWHVCVSTGVIYVGFYRRSSWGVGEGGRRGSFLFTKDVMARLCGCLPASSRIPRLCRPSGMRNEVMSDEPDEYLTLRERTSTEEMPMGR